MNYITPENAPLIVYILATIISISGIVLWFFIRSLLNRLESGNTRLIELDKSVSLVVYQIKEARRENDKKNIEHGLMMAKTLDEINSLKEDKHNMKQKIEMLSQKIDIFLTEE